MHRKYYAAILLILTSPILFLAACQDRSPAEPEIPTLSAGALHNELLRRVHAVGGSDADALLHAALEMRSEGILPADATRAEIIAAIEWGDAISEEIRVKLDADLSLSQWGEFLQDHGVAAADAKRVARTIDSTLRAKKLPTFSHPAVSVAEELFRDVLLHSHAYWTEERHKLNKDQKIVLADAVGGLLGAGWGPFGAIAGAAIVSLIQAG